MQALRNGMSLEECATHFGISEKTARRYHYEIEHPKPPKPPPEAKTEGKGGGQKVLTGGPLAAVTTKAPAPIVFTLGGQIIEIDTQSLYESYLLYSDLKVKCGLKDPFATVLLDAMGFVWRTLAVEPRIDHDRVLVEVNNGRSS